MTSAPSTQMGTLHRTQNKRKRSQWYSELHKMTCVFCVLFFSLAYSAKDMLIQLPFFQKNK